MKKSFHNPKQLFEPRVFTHAVGVCHVAEDDVGSGGTQGFYLGPVLGARLGDGDRGRPGLDDGGAVFCPPW